MRILKICCSLIFIGMLAGCAHSIVISPDPAKIQLSSGQTQSSQNVGYYIPEDLQAKQVVTPGGGGDKVSYQPYRDIETAFYKALSNLYTGVTKLKSTNDPAISSNHLAYVITPTITTNSSSSSPFTWPPTQFSVDLTCKVSDASGNVVATKSVTGNGNADFKEFVHDHALAGKRASEDALLKMQQELSNLGGAQMAAPAAAETSTAANVVVSSVTDRAAPPPLVNSQPVAKAASVSATTSVASPSTQPAAVAASAPTSAAQTTSAQLSPSVRAESMAVAPKNMGFVVGTSSGTVEKLGRQAGCDSKQGAGLITSAGPIEDYQMTCKDGKSFVAHCEFRQCSIVEYQ